MQISVHIYYQLPSEGEIQYLIFSKFKYDFLWAYCYWKCLLKKFFWKCYRIIKQVNGCLTDTVAEPSRSCVHVPQLESSASLSHTCSWGAAFHSLGMTDRRPPWSRSGILGYFYHPSGQEQLTVPKALRLSDLSHGSRDLAFYPWKGDVYTRLIPITFQLLVEKLFACSL